MSHWNSTKSRDKGKAVSPWRLGNRKLAVVWSNHSVFSMKLKARSPGRIERTAGSQGSEGHGEGLEYVSKSFPLK